TTTFAFDNDFPALLPAPGPGEPQPPAAASGASTLLRSVPESGVCRVLCFTPRHDLTLAEMDRPAVRQVGDLWAEETRSLGAREDVGYVQVFENKGAIMGASNPHPHCQAWATGSVPLIPSRKLASQSAYLAAHGRDLLGDYVAEERRSGERLVCANELWTVIVPYWAVWPFETIVVPTRRLPDLPSLSSPDA